MVEKYYVLIDPPGPYATKNEVEDFIEEMKSMDDTPEVRQAIKDAEKQLLGMK